MDKEGDIVLEIYKKENGQEPFTEWLESIKDVKTQLRIINRLNRLIIGNFGDSKSVGAGIYELKMHFGSGYRLYYCKIGKQILLLLCGGDKKTQRRDIELAKDYKKEYLSLR